MFIKSDLPPDHELFEQVDDIKRSIAGVRSFLSENVELGSIEDLPMLRTEVEIFFQAHLRRALAFLEGGKYAADAGHGLVAITAVRCLFELAVLHLRLLQSNDKAHRCW